MICTFYKYQGAGNDFIVIDNRQNLLSKNDTNLIEKLCDRRFGIGADGLMLLENDDDTDFRMVYFNADGKESSMCGNGGRCIVSFAHFLNIIGNETTFNAIDGLHKAVINEDFVNLQMINVSDIQNHETHLFLNTGSPHHVQLVENLEVLDVKTEGAKLRYSNLYDEAGSNINFVKQESDSLFSVRTYERGVEDETLACGTGVTAVAIAMHYVKATNSNEIKLKVEGGELVVSFDEENGNYSNIWLEGEAKQVFKGEIVC